MRYMMMFKTTELPPPGVSACRAELPEMQKLMGELHTAGKLVATEGLMPSDTGARVKSYQGKTSVMDGPFAEAKELVAGFAVVDVADKSEAVDLAKKFLAISGGGECDILEVFVPKH